MKKAVLVDGYSHPYGVYKNQRKLFYENGIEFFIEACASEEEIIDKCRDADAVLTIFGRISRRVIESLEKCKVIVIYAIGFDLIDIEAATEKGIPVCNIPDYCIEEVATHAMALILAMERKIVLYNSSTRAGVWNSHLGYEVHRLSERTLGLVGFGNIARQLAKFAGGFGMSVIACDPYLPQEVFAQNRVPRVSLDELLAQADIISVHVPLTEGTRHLIDKEAIARMKDGVMLVNTSRGPLVCEADLIEGVKSGKIRAAGVDVCESEPITDPNHPLFRYENIIVTPHAAFDSAEALEDKSMKVGITTVKVLAGELPYNVVNRKQLPRMSQ